MCMLRGVRRRRMKIWRSVASRYSDDDDDDDDDET